MDFKWIILCRSLSTSEILPESTVTKSQLEMQFLILLLCRGTAHCNRLEGIFPVLNVFSKLKCTVFDRYFLVFLTWQIDPALAERIKKNKVTLESEYEVWFTACSSTEGFSLLPFTSDNNGVSSPS